MLLMSGFSMRFGRGWEDGGSTPAEDPLPTLSIPGAYSMIDPQKPTFLVGWRIQFENPAGSAMYATWNKAARDIGTSAPALNYGYLPSPHPPPVVHLWQASEDLFHSLQLWTVEELLKVARPDDPADSWQLVRLASASAPGTSVVSFPITAGRVDPSTWVSIGTGSGSVPQGDGEGGAGL
jgi:hypothetical protein